MPTKRTPLTRSLKAKITPEAVELYRRCRELQPTYRRHARNDRHSAWDCDICCAEYREKSHTLHRLLGLRPWNESPLDAEECPSGAKERLFVSTWPMVRRLREALEAALE